MALGFLDVPLHQSQWVGLPYNDASELWDLSEERAMGWTLDPLGTVFNLFHIVFLGLPALAFFQLGWSFQIRGDGGNLWYNSSWAWFCMEATSSSGRSDSAAFVKFSSFQQCEGLMTTSSIPVAPTAAWVTVSLCHLLLFQLQCLLLGLSSWVPCHLCLLISF